MLTFVNSVIGTINNSLKTQFCNFLRIQESTNVTPCSPAQSTCSLCNRQKRNVFSMKVTFIFFPSHPESSLCSHAQSLGHAYLPAFSAKEDTPESSRAAWPNSRGE